MQPPIGEAPSMNVTVPVGVPLPGEVAVTTALYATIWPVTDGFTDDVTAVEVGS